MLTLKDLRLLLAFTIVFSMLVMPGFLGAGPNLPRIHVVHANSAPNVPWYPAGPATDSLDYSIFTDETAEFSGLQAHTIDFTDWPLSPDLVSSFTSDPSLYVTQSTPDAGYFELEFHMGNNFWGCNFNFGNPATQTAPVTPDCGRNIRQAFAHGLDKTQFITTELQGRATPIDNPVPPPTIDPNTPDPCAWDQLFPQTGSGCIVNGPGGTAYHLAPAASCGLSPASLCTSLPGFSYTPGMGTPDFCAAADHLIAAGLATGKNGGPGTGTCVLTGVQFSTINAHPISFFVRSDNTPRLHAGQSYTQFLCALFTGTFSTGCGVSPSTTNIVMYTGNLTSFPGFTTNIGSIALSWWVYTAGFGNVLTADSSLYFTYNSRFVSGFPVIEGGPPGPACSLQATGSFAASNYMYICNPSYDTLTSQAEFANCLSAAGDPATSQINDTSGNNVTFGTCAFGGLSQASALYQAQYIFGKNAYTIPWWSGQNVFAYQKSWDRGSLNAGDGFTPPGNFFTTLDARNPSAVVCSNGLQCLRQGYKQSTGSVNPFNSNTANAATQYQQWDQGVIDSIWDSPGRGNPSSPSSYMEWMTLSTTQIPGSQLGYTPPAGTVFGFRYQLRHDIFWQFASPSTPSVPGSLGDAVTAWDIAFSYVAYQFNGVGNGLAPLTGVHVVSPSQIDILVNAVGPNTKFFLSNSIIPARSWTATCSGPLPSIAQNWDNFANHGLAATSPAAFHAADNSITACIAPSGSVTVLPGGAGNIIAPTGSNVDPNKVAPSYDVVANPNNNLIGSGPWVCESGGTIGGPNCSSSGNSAPPVGGSWTFVRYGHDQTPGGSLLTYFRSNGNLALWIWSQNTGDFNHDGQLFSILASCVNLAPVPAKCNGWGMGIGNTSGTSAALATITSTQVSIVLRFQGVNWVAPFDWRTLPPQNIGAFPPVLYEGAATLNPSTAVGHDCGISYSGGGGYDC